MDFIPVPGAWVIQPGRLSVDERRLFDVVARSYLAAMMPDFRYRQTTAALDVAGHGFRAVGRQPIELGWRAAFPDWQPAEEKGEDAQLLPGLRDGEATLLQDAVVEDKETRPPPRYNEGTLIDAMQNAWRFVDDEALRDRLREAKGIGTPATRAEVIRGLKVQEFLAASGKHIVPTERGLELFAVLERADPALVDPGVTAQLECLLDEVLGGRQEMMGAIDAVCAQAQRIIGRLTSEAGEGRGVAASLGGGGGLVPGRLPPNAVPAQADKPRTRARRNTADQAAKPGTRLRAPSRKAKAAAAPPTTPQATAAASPGETPLRIPFGNKEAAQKFGARYRASGWYAPPGADLRPFQERGWL